MSRSAKEKPGTEFSVPETIELLNCTKNQGSPDYFKAEKKEWGLLSLLIRRIALAIRDRAIFIGTMGPV